GGRRPWRGRAARAAAGRRHRARGPGAAPRRDAAELLAELLLLAGDLLRDPARDAPLVGGGARHREPPGLPSSRCAMRTASTPPRRSTARSSIAGGMPGGIAADGAT